MASASSDCIPVDEINDLLTCSMCLETLNEPRSLSCFHSFCKVCLGEYIFLAKKYLYVYQHAVLKSSANHLNDTNRFGISSKGPWSGISVN
jgi:hypothetical protein